MAAIRAAQLGQARCGRREAEGPRRHLPDLGLHPDQGAARARARVQMMQHAEGVGHHAAGRRAGDRHGQVHARKDKIVGGLTKGVEYLFKKNKIDWIKGTARLAGNGNVAVDRRRQRRARSQGNHRRHRLDAAQRSRHRHRPQADHHERRGDSPARGADFAGDSRQRRRGRRVRLDLPAVRQRGHPGRAAAAAGARRGRGHLRGAGEVVQEAGHRGAHRHTGHRRRAPASGVTIEARAADGTTQAITPELLLVATGRGPVTDGLGAEERGPDDGPRLRHRRRAVSHLRAGHFRHRRRDHRRRQGAHPQLAHVSSAEGILVAERLAGQDVQPLNYDHVPGCTYCDPEIGSVGLTEAEAKARGLRRASGNVPVRRARPGQDGGRDRGLRQDRGRRANTTRCWACT